MSKRHLMVVLAAVLCVAAIVALLPDACAAGLTGPFNKCDVDCFISEFLALRKQVAMLETQVTTLQSQVTTLQSVDTTQQGQITTLQGQVATIKSALAAVQANNALLLGPYVTVDPGTENGLKGPHVIFRGANVHIESGSGTTVDTTGLGNMLVGYDSDSATGACVTATIDANRNGSHNLIVGDCHQFTDSGGLVAGFNNQVTGPYSSVSGGAGNTASGYETSVSGGVGNTASEIVSSVSGGYANTASGFASSVSGGVGNTASEHWSSVSGGGTNTASGQGSSVGGGYELNATATDEFLP